MYVGIWGVMIDPAFREASGAEGSRSRGLQEQEAPSKRLHEASGGSRRRRLEEASGATSALTNPLSCYKKQKEWKHHT